MKIILLDPDGDHVQPYVDGKRRDGDRGLSHTSRFLDWCREEGIILTPAVEYRYAEADDDFPPETVDDPPTGKECMVLLRSRVSSRAGVPPELVGSRGEATMAIIADAMATILEERGVSGVWEAEMKLKPHRAIPAKAGRR